MKIHSYEKLSQEGNNDFSKDSTTDGYSAECMQNWFFSIYQFSGKIVGGSKGVLEPLQDNIKYVRASKGRNVHIHSNRAYVNWI